MALALASGCSSTGPIEGQAFTGVAILTSSTDAGLALKAANDSLDISPRALLDRTLARARATSMSKPAFEGAEAPDPTVAAHPWSRDDWWILTKYVPAPAGVTRVIFFGLASPETGYRHDMYVELTVVLLPLALKSVKNAGVEAKINVLYAIPRESNERTWGIRFWRSAFQELREEVRDAIGAVGELSPPLPVNGQERK